MIKKLVERCSDNNAPETIQLTLEWVGHLNEYLKLTKGNQDKVEEYDEMVEESDSAGNRYLLSLKDRPADEKLSEMKKSIYFIVHE